MPQVIIVSNRLPISVKKEDGELKFSPSVGGFAAPLAAYVADSQGKNKNRWIGWPGIASDGLTDDERQQIVAELAKQNCNPVFLSQREVDNFYSGYSNDILWPLFHNLARPRKVTPEQRKRWWAAYRSVNEKYAQAALNIAETASRIWIHDYQLLLVPELLRQERSDIISGFFLHIPFPTVKTFSKVNEHKKLLQGMLGADVIGFHTPGYVANFLDNCQAAGLVHNTSNMITMSDHTVRVGDFPMGIDYQKFANSGKSKVVKAAMRKYRKRYKGKRVIVSVDRLDPIKGLLERVEAYGTLLETRPKLRGKVVLSMVAAPSRTDIPAYKNLAKRMDTLVAKINQTYGTKKWQPIDYMNISVPFEEVTALFRIADVAFIAPLVDGMNLAAKEFIASKQNNGVLILSETAGAAQELPDAILVNPKKPQELVDALQKSLSMRRRELRSRLRRMKQQLAANTVNDWTENFITALNRPIPGTGTRSLRPRPRQTLIDDFRQAKRHLLLLDYDGSLVPFSEDYRDAAPPKSLRNLIEALSADPTSDVVIISGRGPDDLHQWFGNLPVNLVAEHGAAYKRASSKSWKTIEKIDTDWKRSLQPVLEKYTALTPGAHIEVKPHSLVWHYRASPPYYASKYAVIIKKTLRPMLKKYGLELMQGNKALEIKNSKVGKGIAAQSWLKSHHDFVLAIGDDLTDEDLFAMLPVSGGTVKSYSIKVGRGRTLADYRVPSYKAVLSLLKKLSQ